MEKKPLCTQGSRLCRGLCVLLVCVQGLCAGVVRISLCVGYAHPLGRGRGFRAMIVRTGFRPGCLQVTLLLSKALWRVMRFSGGYAFCQKVVMPGVMRGLCASFPEVPLWI